MPCDLAVVIVSYEARERLQDCLRSLPGGADGLSLEVIVVDNASSDGSAEMVERDFPHVSLIRNKENVGFARASNAGMERASAREVLLLNPDTVVAPAAFRRMLDVAEQYPEVGLVAPRLLNPSDRSVQASFRRFPSLRSVFGGFALTNAFLRRLPETPWRPEIEIPTTAGWLTGACLLVRRGLWKEIGGLDEGYFLYYEDADYCRRAIRAGWKLLLTESATVIHYGGTSIGRVNPGAIRLMTLRSLFRYLSRDYSPLMMRMVTPCVKFLVLVSALAAVAENGLKALVYPWVRRTERAERHRRRFLRNKEFLARYVWEFLRS